MFVTVNIIEPTIAFTRKPTGVLRRSTQNLEFTVVPEPFAVLPRAVLTASFVLARKRRNVFG